MSWLATNRLDGQNARFAETMLGSYITLLNDGMENRIFLLPVQLSSGKLDDANSQIYPNEYFWFSTINILPQSLVRMRVGSKNLCCILVGLSNQDIPYEIGEKRNNQVVSIFDWMNMSVQFWSYGSLEWRPFLQASFSMSLMGHN